MVLWINCSEILCTRQFKGSVRCSEKQNGGKTKDLLHKKDLLLLRHMSHRRQSCVIIMCRGLAIQITQINAIVPPAAEMRFKPFKILQTSWPHKAAAKASYEMCDYSKKKKKITMQPHCSSLTLGNKGGGTKVPSKAKLAVTNKSYKSHKCTTWIFLTINKCVHRTVTWNVVQHVWCRSQWWETAGCFLHGGLL